jgi:hypothetical protein
MQRFSSKTFDRYTSDDVVEMERFSFKVFDRSEFDEASEGDLISGLIQRGTSRREGIVRLGKRVKNPPNSKDPNTELKKFIYCDLFICESHEHAKQKIPLSQLPERYIITILYSGIHLNEV